MNKNIRTASLTILFVVCAGALLVASRNSWAATPSQSTAVLVELFTSEGCSSCPPADALLESLDRSSGASGPKTVVLSEHVDYWNQIGWTDPYSSPRFSERQRVYASRLHLQSVYTPQMVVDGSVEFVGSDAQRAKAAIAHSARAEKAIIRILPGADGGKALTVRVEVDALPSQAANADVYLALAVNEATSQVLRGENGGRRLRHVAVVRSLNSIGTMNRGASFVKEVSLPLNKQPDTSQLRLVAFVQEQGQGKVLGVVMRAATP